MTQPSSSASTSTKSPLFERILRGLIVGILAVFLFYIKLLGAILKLGIRMVKAVPLGRKTAE